MRIIGTFSLCAAIAASLVPASEAFALALGRLRGAALIGRPLAVSVPITLDAGEPEPCLQAEVLQGDSRMSGVSLRIEAAPGGGQQVRVSSSAVVEEPVVTVYLRVGCGQQFTRRYVVLAEQPDDAGAVFATPAARAAVPAAVPVPAAAPAPSAPQAVARGAPVPLRTESQLRPRRPVAAPAARGEQERPTARKRRGAAAESPAAAAGPRLKLEPLDLSIDSAPVLRVTPLLQSQESGGAQRAQAAALWLALNTPPEDWIRQNQRLETMEREVRALRETMQRETAALGQAGQQLQKARSERNGITTALLVLALALAAIAMAWLWRRSRGSEGARRWWQGAAPAPESEFPPQLRPAARSQVPAPAKPDLDLSGFDELRPEQVRGGTPAARRPGASDFMHSQPTIARMVKAEELIDIQQQAEFFQSIGQTEQALSLLEAHVHDHVETSPLAWLDLFEIYHALGRREDFQRVRAEFHALFNAQVPDFDSYRSESAGLEDYRRALSRIVALWPSPRVLSVIEESIFRRPGTPGAEPFSLEAYRDLVLLYNVAKDITQEVPSTSGAPLPDGPTSAFSPPSEFSGTDFDPFSVVSELPQTGVDIDLAALPAAEAAKAPLPDLTFDFDSLPPKRR